MAASSQATHALVSDRVGKRLIPDETFPVVEIFGPTIQGEGIDQGIPCHFVRFGGCDYRCDWCDSLHAVLPHLVRRAEKLTAKEIADRVSALPGARWVILSGGNPALLKLHRLVELLRSDMGFYVAVETQGTRWKEWLWQVDRVAVSPKPPSSGERTDPNKLQQFMGMLTNQNAFLKIVIKDQRDLEFARGVHERFPEFQMFLSACNDAGPTVGNPQRVDERDDQQVALDLIAQGRKLANWVMADPNLYDVRVQVQNHVLYWGNQRGR